MFLLGSIINFFERDVNVSGMLAIWDILSQVFLYWLGTLGFIVITILVLMGVSMSFDTLVWAWRRGGEEAGAPAAPAAWKAKDACGGVDGEAEEEEEAGAETDAEAEADAGAAGAGGTAVASAATERGKGAKWKKSSQRAAERRRREAQSGRATPPFPLLFTKRPRGDASDDACDASRPDKDDPDAIYAEAFSASVKHLSRSDGGAEPNEEGVPGDGGGGGGRTSDCADTDTESLRSRSDYGSSNSSSSGGSGSSSSSSSSSKVGASGDEGTTPADAEVAPAAPAVRQQREVIDLPGDTVAAGAGGASDAEAGHDSSAATQKTPEKTAAVSDPQNMQVALLSNTRRNYYTARSLSDASFHATARGDIRRLLSPYSSLVDAERWEKMGLINVSKNRLVMSSLLPNARYFSATITKNNAMITTCLATIDKLKQNASEKTLNLITNTKRKKITSLLSENSPDSARENSNKGNKSLDELSNGAKQACSPLVTMHEQSSTEILKKKLQAWSCVPPAAIRSPSQTTILSTLMEVSEIGSSNNLKPSEVKGTGSFVLSKIPKALSTPGKKGTSSNQWKSNTRPKSANSPSKSNTPNKSTNMNTAKPNSPPKSPPLSVKRPPSTNPSAKGGKVQPNNSGPATNFPRTPILKALNQKVPTDIGYARYPSRSIGGNQQTPKPGTPQGSPTKNPSQGLPTKNSPQGSPTKNSPQGSPIKNPSQGSPTKNPAPRGPQVRMRR